MQYPKGHILVFAKAPILGTVKTRLRPVLTEDECCTLQQELILHTLNTVTQAGLCEVELWCAPELSHPFFEHCKNTFNITLKQQSGADLGERMHHALASTLIENEFSILIGSDCPFIDKAYLKQTCEILSEKKQDIVLGPANDGGYVLIAARTISPLVFTNINWGSTSVLNATRNNLRKTKLSFAELGSLSDIDRPEDLPLVTELLTQLSF